MDRRTVTVGGLGTCAAEVSASFWYPVPVYLVCLASAGVLLALALATAWWRTRRLPATFLVDEQDRSFRTPVHAGGLLLGLAGLQLTGFFLALSRESWAAMLGALLVGGLLGGSWRMFWYGPGLTLRPDGIEAGKSTGALVIPWEALASEQPGRGTPWWKVNLAYARPELVTSTGWAAVRDVVVFEGVDPDLVTTAIAGYAAEPGRRHAIGTVAELERLQEVMPAPRRGIRQLTEPAPTRTTVRRVIVASLLLAGSAVADWYGWLWLVAPAGAIASQQLFLAVAGWRAHSRALRNTRL